MSPRRKSTWICFNQMLLLILTPALCDPAFMCVQHESQSNWNFKKITFNETNCINFYKCLVTASDRCQIIYELYWFNVTQIVESGSSSNSALPIYTCKNNQSTSSICCSREDQCNCKIASYDFAFVWNNSPE